MDTPRRVILLDDHPVLLHGMRVMLDAEPSVQVVGAYATAREFLAAVDSQQESINIAIVDYSLGPEDVDCRNLLMAMRRRFPGVPVLVLSAQHNAMVVRAAMRAGARGYLPKTSRVGDIIEAIDALCRGNIHLQADMMQQFRDDRAAPLADEHLVAVEALTPREREVLLEALEGHGTIEIAARLDRATSTVSAQKRSAYRKLGVRTDNDLHRMRHLLELK